MIGYLEEIIFNVSEREILTFKELSHSSSAKFHDHEIIGQKPLSEFLGCDLDKISLKIELNQELGANISETLEKIKQYEISGTPLNFVVGHETFGSDKWVIESSSRAYDYIYQNGVITSVSVDLNLSEFITDADLQPNQKPRTAYYNKVENATKTAIADAYKIYGVAKDMNALLNTIIS